MSELAKCKNEIELSRAVGGNAYYQVLRDIILSSRAHFVSLPQELKLRECPNAYQFIALAGTPERETAFQDILKGGDSIWLWHGSCLQRWHSILVNGLKDLGATSDKTHEGAMYGAGIYESELSSYSWSYATGAGLNNYTNSALPKGQLSCMALCENAGTLVKNSTFDHEYMQLNSYGLLVRFLIINPQCF